MDVSRVPPAQLYRSGIERYWAEERQEQRRAEASFERMLEWDDVVLLAEMHISVE